MTDAATAVPSASEARRIWQQRQQATAPRWADLTDDGPETTTPGPQSEVAKLRAMVEDLAMKVHRLESAENAAERNQERGRGSAHAARRVHVTDAEVQTEVATFSCSSADQGVHVKDAEVQTEVAAFSSSSAYQHGAGALSRGDEYNAYAGHTSVHVSEGDMYKDDELTNSASLITSTHSDSGGEMTSDHLQCGLPSSSARLQGEVDPKDSDHLPASDASNGEGLSAVITPGPAEDDEATTGEEAGQASPEQRVTKSRRRRRCKGKAKHCRAADEVSSTTLDASASRASATSSGQQLGTDPGWAVPLFRSAIECAERGGADESLEALMRLLLRDYTLTLPRSALYAVEFQRVTGGWQVTICLGYGREIAGAVRPSTASARLAAMDEAMRCLELCSQAPCRGPSGAL